MFTKKGGSLLDEVAILPCRGILCVCSISPNGLSVPSISKAVYPPVRANVEGMPGIFRV